VMSIFAGRLTLNILLSFAQFEPLSRMNNVILRDSSSHLERILLPDRSNLFQSHCSNQWLAILS
jgi:hypothetical protein